MPNPFRAPRGRDPFRRAREGRPTREIFATGNSSATQDTLDGAGQRVGAEFRPIFRVDTGRMYVRMDDPEDDEYGSWVELGSRLTRLILVPRDADPGNPQDGEVWVLTAGEAYGYLDGTKSLLGDKSSAAHVRLHAVTNTADHSAGNWKVLYTDGSGHVIELALGADGTFLQANGAAAAPTFGALEDGDIPSTIARDSEVTTAVSDHAGAADPHTGYQKESEKNAASGYCGLDANSRVDPTQMAELVKSITIETPVAADNITIGFFDKAMTITQVNDVIQGATSVTWNLKHATTRNSGSPNSLFSSDRVTSSAAGAETSTFADATIPAGSWLWYKASAISGTPTELSVTFHYTFD